MADYNSTATSTIYVNGKPAEAELQKLKQRARDLRDAIASAAKAGDKASLKKLRSELNQTKREVREVEGAMHAAEVVMKRLDKATPKELQATLRQLKKELNDMERGTEAWDKQVAKIKQVKSAIDDVNNEMKEHESLLSRVNNAINKWGMSVASAAAALTGVTMTVRQAVEAYVEMDQEMANVQKFTGMSREEVESLNEEFKKIDTRTSREGLNQLAQEAGRLGKSSQEDVWGFVRAADKINVALDDLGEGATLTLSKLTGVFGTEAIYGTEQSLLKVGSVINELSQNSAASAPYLAEFASRLGGVGSQAGMTVQQIMAYGAVLDANQQQLESSSTALSQLIVKLYRDPAKYAKAAGLDVQKFTDLLKKDANEAVLTLLDTLNKAGGMDALAPMFADMGEKGSRSVATLSMLAAKIDDVRAQQQEANKAFEEGTSIDREFNVQNNTVAAGLDKAKNRFHEMAVELGKKLAPAARYALSGTSALMEALSTGINFIVKHKGALIVLTAAIVAYTLAANAAAIKTKALAAAKVAHKAATEALTAAQALLSSAMSLLSGNVKAATQSFKIFSATIRANPIGLAVAAVTALAGAVYLLSKRTTAAQEAQRRLNSIQEDAKVKAIEQKQKIEDLVAAAGDFTIGIDNQRKALNELNSIIPGFNGRIDAQAQKFTYAKDKLDDYINSLIKLYEVEGAKKMLIDIGEKKAEEIMRQEQIKEEIKKEPVTNGNYNYSTSQGGSAPAAAYMPSRRAALQVELNESENRVRGYDATTNAIKNRYGHDINKQAANSVSEPNSPEDKITPTGGSTSTGKTGGRGGGGSRSKPDRFAAEKAWREREEALNRIAYATGEIEYQEYTERMSEIAQQFYQKQLQHKDLTENEKLTITAQYSEEALKLEELHHKNVLAENERSFNELYASIQQDYIDNKISKSEYDMQMENAEMAHLHSLVQLSEEGSDERLKAEENLRKKLLEGIEKRNKAIADAEKAHQDKLKEIYKQYFSPSQEEKQALYDSTVTLLDEVYKTELAKVGDDNAKKLDLEKRYLAAKKKLHDEIFAKEEKDNQERGKNWEQWTHQWLDKIFGEGTWEKYGGFITSAVSSISASWQDLTKLVEAEEQAKLAAMTKKYDAEIKAAEGNQYRINQINKRKEAEEKRIKDAANKRAMAMEMAQAIASTALAAINAYKTAPAPVMIFGPIAAGMALAAGAVQIAAIKKQHEAQAQGYAEGGFTRPGAKDEPAGIVHAGEWVASQRLLASPVARPMIEFLDYAQRTNTIGRLATPSSPISGGAPSVQSPAQPVVVTESQEMRNAIRRLNERLNQPFVTINTVTGDHGIKQAQDEYRKLMNNTLPKNKRT